MWFGCILRVLYAIASDSGWYRALGICTLAKEKVKELMDAEDFALPPLDVAVEKLRETVSV